MERCAPNSARTVHLVTNQAIRRIRFSHSNLQNHWLTVRNERTLTTGQLRNERQFHPLHRGFDAPQRVAANQNFVSGKNQSELLFLSVAFEFGESKLIERQQDRAVCRNFNA